MKKTLALLLSLVFILAACSNQTENNSKADSRGDNRQFKRNTLKLAKSSITIKDVHILNNKDDGTKNIAFEYEVKNDTTDDSITAMQVWAMVMKTYQDSDNTVNELKVGLTPMVGEYKEYYDHMNDGIKKGKTAKGVFTYTLQNDKPVILKARSANQKLIGEKEYKIDNLKTKDYSYVEYSQQEAQQNLDENHPDEADSSNQNIDSSEPVKQDDKQVASTSPVQSTTNNQSETKPQEVVSEQPTPKQVESKKDTPKQNDISQGGIGGHPSMLDPSIPQPTGEPQMHKDGNVY